MMLPTAVQENAKEALNRCLESIGWGLFLIIIGALWLSLAAAFPKAHG